MDPAKQFAEDDAKTLAEINLRRKAAGLPAFAQLDNDAEMWAVDNPPAGAATPAAEAVPPTAEPEKKEEPAQAVASVPAAFVPEAHAVVAGGGREAELERELQRLKSEQGRSTVLANELKALKAQVEEANKRAEDAERKAQELAEKASQGDILAGLSQEEREAISDNPAAAAAIAKIAKMATKGVVAQPDLSEVKEIQKRLEQREMAEAERAGRQHQIDIQKMFAEVAKEVPADVYSKFPAHEKWAGFNMSTFGGIENYKLYQAALDALDKDATVAWFNRFMRYAGITLPAKGPKPPLRIESTTGSDAAGHAQTDAPKVFKYEDVARIESDWMKRKALPPGWTAEQFQRWSDEVDVARAEGRVVDASGNARAD